MGNEERFRQALLGLGPDSTPSGLDTDLVLGRGRRAARLRRIRWAAAAMVVISAAVPLAITMTHGGKAPDNVVDLPPTPNPSSHLTPQAVEECHTLVRSSRAQSGPMHLRGLAQATTEEGTTVVVGNNSWMWTCNIDPDDAVTVTRPASPAGVALTPTNPWNFRVAAYAAATYIPGATGDLVWAGGVVPRRDTTQILYHFPDGHIEPAAITEGPNGVAYWAMQYVSPKPLGREDDHPISVEVFVGTSGKPFWTIDLKWGEDTCAVAQRCERTPSGME